MAGPGLIMRQFERPCHPGKFETQTMLLKLVLRAASFEEPGDSHAK
jgi:hypothetical protein